MERYVRGRSFCRPSRRDWNATETRARGATVRFSRRARCSGFKGGSEPNVMAVSAMAVRQDGRVVAVCVCRRGDIGDGAAAQVAKWRRRYYEKDSRDNAAAGTDF